MADEVITVDERGKPTVPCPVCGTKPEVRMVPLPGLSFLCVSYHEVDGKRCDGTKRHATEKLRDYLPRKESVR